MSADPIWRDDPLSSREGDDLGTVHIAEKAAELIKETHSFGSSTVIGLVGPWGSGKSSIAAMCCQILDEDRLEDGSPKWAIGRFTPWATSDAYTMMEDFYSALVGALPADKGKRVREKLGRLIRAGTPALKLIPYAGSVASDSAGLLAEKLLEQQSWAEAFQEASDRLAAEKTPVLIVVDDVDRLQQTELVNLLKVVRLLGRFPGVSYLLAYDEQTLFANLQRAELGTSTRHEARLFMEKVVQYPVTVPPLLESQIMGLLDSGLERLFMDLDRFIDEADTRLGLLVDVYLSQLRTPRAINRFLAQVRLTLSMHDSGEIDDVDVIMLTLLRVQFPDLFAALPQWKSELTGSGMSRRIFTIKDEGPDFESLWSTVDEGADRRDARSVMKVLFPRTDGNRGDGPRQRICNGDYFDRYFLNAVPTHDITDGEVRRALEEAGTPGSAHDLLRQLVTGQSLERSELAVRRLQAISMEELNEDKIIPLLGAVMKLWPEVPSGRGWLADPSDRMRYWAKQLISRLSDATVDDLIGVLEECPDFDGPLRLLWSVHNETRDPLATAIAEVAKKFADDAIPSVVEHLQMGDDAPLEELVGFRLRFIALFGGDAAIEEVSALVGHTVCAETLASRFVSVGHSVGPGKPSSKLMNFDQEFFARYAPDCDVLYDTQPEEALDLADLSWPNRRAYTRGRATRPVQ